MQQREHISVQSSVRIRGAFAFDFGDGGDEGVVTLNTSGLGQVGSRFGFLSGRHVAPQEARSITGRRIHDSAVIRCGGGAVLKREMSGTGRTLPFGKPGNRWYPSHCPHTALQLPYSTIADCTVLWGFDW